MKLDRLWRKVGEAYPILSKQAYQVIVLFVTTYLCKSGFSVLMSIKTKERSKLKAEHDM
jgi:hypothetical protein